MREPGWDSGLVVVNRSTAGKRVVEWLRGSYLHDPETRREDGGNATQHWLHSWLCPGDMHGLLLTVLCAELCSENDIYIQSRLLVHSD